MAAQFRGAATSQVGKEHKNNLWTHFENFGNLRCQKEEAGMVDISSCTASKIDNFKFFVKFLAHNDLIDEAYEELKKAGVDEIIVTMKVVEVIQDMLRRKKQDGSLSAKDADRVIESAHHHC